MRLLYSALTNLFVKEQVGGQAVIEGVLMKGPVLWALAVRKPNGEIWTKTWKVSEWFKKGIWKLPIVRGFTTLIEMMRVGIRALNLSAEISLEENEEISTLEMLGAILVAVLAVILFFVILPMYLSEYITSRLTLSNSTKNILEGIFRGSIFIGYIAFISFWNEMRQVFCYHGAEHKVINAYENDAELTPDAVKSFSRIHSRCGTSFLIVVISISIIIFSIIGDVSFIWRVLSRVVLLPFVIGISYELIKFLSSTRGRGNNICIAPALAMQYLTTKEPTLDQIEVAIVSLKLALNFEQEIEV